MSDTEIPEKEDVSPDPEEEQKSSAPVESEAKEVQEQPSADQRDQEKVEPEPDTSKFGAVPFSAAFEVRADKRLPNLDVGPVKAYEATGKGKYGGNYFTLISEYHLIPRISATQVFENFSNTNLIKLVHYGIINWPPTGGQRYAFVYESILGKPLAARGDKQALGLKPELILATVVKQVIGVLRDFRDKDFVHGNIRADNIFSTGANFEKVVLGDCLSTPPSFMQPCIYEPIERAMADPVAKGLGTRIDDMYALGVTLAVLLRHHDPLEGMNDREIIRQKIENGSFIALMGKERLTGPILELLRGLLYDDPNQRWTFEEIEDWMDGQRLSPKQLTKKIIAARPITFNSKRYLRPSVLAMELHDNLNEAVQMVEDGILEQWLERSLEIKEAEELLARALKSAEETGRGPSYKERLICRVSIILDSEGPLRIGGHNMRPDGVGHSLVQSLFFKQDLQPYAELVSDQTVLFWLEFNKNSKVDANAIVSRFESCRAYVRHKNIGYGIERCIYILSPECHCLSEKLRNYYVRSPEDLMYAFEDMCEKGNAPISFLDRHIVAFISVKDRNMVDPYLIDINSKEDHSRILSHLRTLAAIQSRSRMEKFPAITRAITAMLDPVYVRYHDRDLRESLKKRVEGLKDSGDLGKIKNILVNAELSRKDYRSFRKAMIEYNGLQREKIKLSKNMEREGEFGKNTGKQIAAMVSGLLGGAIILLFTIFTFSGG